MITRPDISHIIIMGDSLTDRGTLYKEKLFGFIPMSVVAGIAGTSPADRFTNGLPWSDHFIASLANELTIKLFMRKKKWRNDDIADAIIDNNIHMRHAVDNFYNLRDDKEVDYRKSEFVRCYAEGGLTSHSYKWVPSTSIKRFFTRLILSTLQQKRADLLSFDQDNPELSTIRDKAKTLIIEWTGANDLITVNKRPSMKEADKALADRIRNIEDLIEHGYRHFFLMNLPDLSLTPRYQAQSKHERENASQCSSYFNSRLVEMCAQLQRRYPDCTIEVADINSEFVRMYQNPELYQMDRSKLHQPYIKSTDFRILKNGTSPATGYMFWDDVHPTADVHAMFAYLFCERYSNRFNFIAPGPLLRHRDEGLSRRGRVLVRTRSCDSLPLNQFGILCHTHHDDHMRQYCSSRKDLRRQWSQSRMNDRKIDEENGNNHLNKKT